MGKQRDQDKLKALAAELAKDIKSEEDLGTLTQQLIKLTVETALNAEMDEHLGYEKHAPQGRGTGNNRNGYSTKRLKGQHGEVTIQAPRDRNASFEPQFVRKGQSRLTQMDDQILALYAKGLNTRDIVDAFKEMYDADISAGLVSKVTERVIEQVHEWQNRPQDPLYPIVYLDCIVLKIRGLEDILIACVDGLKGFPDAIAVEYPQTKVQLCIVHMVRNSLRYVSWKDYKAVTAELKQIYQSATEREAQQALAAFGERWDSQYPQIARSWQNNWDNLITLFDYPPAIRKVIYTTNAIESLNSVLRKATKQRKLFPTDESALKVAFLAIQQASKKWTMPIQNWKLALNRFIIEFGDRLNGHL
ncbi:IS256 family transposase [Aeromonas allosaccharophila]